MTEKVYFKLIKKFIIKKIKLYARVT